MPHADPLRPRHLRLVPPDPSAALLEWWEESHRKLPWRETRDPWAILVSEVMLQQTQVNRVIPKWHEFLERYPTPAACAAAPVADIVRMWVGLGYNRRAVYLHRTATIVVDRHGGEFPDDLDALLALPGVGPYTARAILVFAFERDIGLVDTNAGRFVARALAGRAVDRKEAQELADAAVPPGKGWAWGQAVFDLGDEICRKRAPSCGTCPFVGGCAWVGAGRPEPDPIKGSAGISRGQTPLAGSDRMARALLVITLCRRPVAAADVPEFSGLPKDPERAARIAESLVADGLAVRTEDGGLSLPERPARG